MNYTLEVLIRLTQDLPIGTNKALLHFLWMLVSGSLLGQRGALFPALQAIGLGARAVRRAWRAFREGVWQIGGLISVWREYVEAQPEWEVYRYEGYRAVNVDLTAFWRPQLQDCPSQHYHAGAGRALPAVIMGIAADSGHIGGQRLALPRRFVRVSAHDPSERSLQEALLRQTGRDLAADEVAVLDAGFRLSQIHAAGLENYVTRLAGNFTAHRNVPAPYKGQGRYPIYGEKIRPLPRTYAGRSIAGSQPDETVQWTDNEHTLRADIWRDLILPGVIPDPQADMFTVYVIHDPRFAKPWVLATDLPLSAKAVHGIYTHRWSVEQIPLSAKHMVGAHRQFVFAPESVQRLPELALLMGSVLSFLAATAPPQPTGFWDRNPQPTPGRFRRTLQGQPFPESYPLPARIREKKSVTAHLPKGIHGHRRQSRQLDPAHGL